MQDTATCPHVPAIYHDPRASACERCGEERNLRVCVGCGHVGCCESHNAHNTAHYRDSGHPVIRSLPLGEGSFTWCYECQRYL